jgi:polysaccharide export outer membrane protein
LNIEPPQKKIHMIARLVCMLSISVFLSACVATERAAYYAGVDKLSIAIDSIQQEDPVIQKNDILSINISSLNPEASAVFNAPNTQATSTSTTTGSTSAGGYLVNLDGMIQLPILGNIQASGMTKKSLKSYITKLIEEKKLLVDPIVTIRHLNFEVTVLGEVNKPTVINVPSEKISIMKALGLAGDITIYGKKENVLLIREKAGVRTVTRLNLNDKNFLTSPFYYLQPNDVVYVQPNERKILNANRNQQLLPTILSVLSIAAIIITNLIRNTP